MARVSQELRILRGGLVALLATAFAPAAWARTCDDLTKVVNAANGAFTSLQGNRIDGVTWEGKIRIAGAKKCIAYFKKHGWSSYTCRIADGGEADLPQMKTLARGLENEIEACLRNVQYRQRGNVINRYDSARVSSDYDQTDTRIVWRDNSRIDDFRVTLRAELKDISTTVDPRYISLVEIEVKGGPEDWGGH